MFTEIKNLYEEIRFLTDETNKGKSSDIDEIRKNILLLETKIKELKKFMQSELETLGKEELSLNDQQKQINNRKVKSATITIPNKIIAPSPVKVLIQSPFKCLEVQQFQEFMKHNKRFGGWNQYDHNQFIQIWNAYYTSDLNISQGIDINNSEMCDHLIQDLMTKIIGTNREDIISHIQWYTQYLKLYTCQKKAVQKWKENRNKIKKYNKGNNRNERRVKSRYDVEANPQRSTSISSDDSLFWDVPASSEKSSEDIGDKDKIQTIAPYKSRLMEPTKQWLYRCNNENDARAACNIETVKKLSIPAWRIGLQN
ncbi:coiled-coil domain-containing protein 112-like [Aricia agestis]|uniref:coiled-coil domain-containing protein 112-like n=1 Tax=Aricia agestis TaxID=91739 RepID=UPI001C20C1E9|nr:coiled-coil domain-containing protein 112-like [Aricia agestis]